MDKTISKCGHKLSPTIKQITFNTHIPCFRRWKKIQNFTFSGFSQVLLISFNKNYTRVTYLLDSLLFTSYNPDSPWILTWNIKIKIKLRIKCTHLSCPFLLLSSNNFKFPCKSRNKTALRPQNIQYLTWKTLLYSSKIFLPPPPPTSSQIPTSIPHKNEEKEKRDSSPKSSKKGKS